MTRTALVLGPTGLVGHELVAQLAEDDNYAKVVAFVRRPPSAADRSPKVEWVVVDYDDPTTYRSKLAVDDVFCCLGTTIKKAGSPAAFTHVDKDLPLAIAKASLEAGAKKFLVVTAVGANPKSRTLYSRVKGELEEALRTLSFPEGLVILHPSLLLGDRAEKRLGEELATVVMGVLRPIFNGSRARYRPIEGTQVAAALIRAARVSDAGVRVLEGEALFAR